MSDKPFDPFRYSVETVPPLVRKGLARMTVPELGVEDLEPPAGLKQRLGTLASEESGSSPGPLSARPSAPEASLARPTAGPPPRRLSKAVLLALGVALASLALALLRS